MRIAILGGTGNEGRGLGKRLARSGHMVVLGSRDEERARAVAAELAGESGTVEGATNRAAAEGAELVIVAVPFAGHLALLEELREPLQGKVVLDTVVPLDFKARRPYAPPVEGSAAEQAQAALGAGAQVVAGLHQIAAHELSLSDHTIEADGLICSDHLEAKRVVFDIVRALGVRPVDAGGLRNAAILEALTPLLIDINRRNKVKAAGIRITGL